MEKLKRLALSFALTSVIAVSAFAQAPPCLPGQTSSPPCTSGMTASAPGETNTPPTSDTVDVTDIAEAVLWALSLF